MLCRAEAVGSEWARRAGAEEVRRGERDEAECVRGEFFLFFVVFHLRILERAGNPNELFHNEIPVKKLSAGRFNLACVRGNAGEQGCC